MSTIIYFDKESGVPIYIDSPKQEVKDTYGLIVSSIMKAAVPLMEGCIGKVRIMGFDVLGKGGREIMTYVGGKVSVVYIGEKDAEINEAYLRDTVAFFDQLLSGKLIEEEKDRLRRNKLEKLKSRLEKVIIEGEKMDASLVKELKEFVRVPAVMKRRTEKSGLREILIDLSEGTIDGSNDERFAPDTELKKGAYMGVRDAVREIYERIEGEKSDPESVAMIIFDEKDRKFKRIRIK